VITKTRIGREVEEIMVPLNLIFTIGNYAWVMSSLK
jgi:hypothetical protein